MTWIETVPDGGEEGRLARSYDAARKRAGRVFGIVRAMSPSPGTLDASMALYGQVMMGASPLSRRRREMLAVVVSRANDCHY